MTKASKRQFLCTVGAIPNRTFAAAAGGAKTAAVNKWYDGGAIVPDVIASPPETSNLTLTNAFDPDIDPALLQSLKAQVGIMNTTITKVPLYGDMTRVASAKPDVYTGAVLVGVTPVESDANSGDTGTYVLEFAVSDLT